MASIGPEVVLVDDALVVRRGLELVLGAGGLRVSGVAATRAQATALLTRRRFDCAIVADRLEGLLTTPWLAELLAERPEMPLLVLGGRDDAALRAATTVGAKAIVLTTSPPELLFDAVAAVARGETFRDPGLVRRLPEPALRPRRVGVAQLSPREREILGLLARGRTGAEVAGELFLSPETVRTHVRNAVDKLGARTRTQAVALLVDDAGGIPGD